MSELKLPSHNQELLANAEGIQACYPEGLPMAVAEPTALRDDAGVFSEAERFSGAYRLRKAAAYVTAAASPHVLPSLAPAELTATASTVFHREVHLPEPMNKADAVAAQLVVWWRREQNEDGRGEGAELLRIATLPAKEQRDFCKVISRQTTKAVDIITNIMNPTMAEATHAKPIIYGSWGHDGNATGRARGIPSNPHGHLHVTDFVTANPETVPDKTMSPKQKLNFFKAWANSIHKRFGNPLGQAIDIAIHEVLGDEASASVSTFSTELAAPNNEPIEVNGGHKITFKTGQEFDKVFGALIKVAGTFETFYQDVTTIHSQFYKYQSEPSSLEGAHKGIAAKATEIGFSTAEAEQLSDYVLRIRPTYSQICNWLDELGQELQPEQLASNTDMRRLSKQKEVYERASKLANLPGNRDSLASALVRGTVAPSAAVRDIGGVLPEHASMMFSIEDYERADDERILVKSVDLRFSGESTFAPPEAIKFRTLVREVRL